MTDAKLVEVAADPEAVLRVLAEAKALLSVPCQQYPNLGHTDAWEERRLRWLREVR